MELMLQNFELVMFIIAMIITAELLGFLYVVFHKKKCRKKKHNACEKNDEHEAVKSSENKDEYGFVFIDLDEDDDLHFDFIYGTVLGWDCLQMC